MDKYQSKLAILIISLFPDEMQLLIGNRLNGWCLHWSLVLPFFNYYLIGRKSKMKLTAPVFNYIDKKFGHKEVLRYHNVRSKEKGDMTNQQFEHWWTLCVESNNHDLYYNMYPL